MPAWYSWQDSALIINIKVQSSAKKDEIIGLQGDQLKIRIAAAPIDGKANHRLIGFLASLFRVRKSAITFVSGRSNRQKRLKIAQPNDLTVLSKYLD